MDKTTPTSKHYFRWNQGSGSHDFTAAACTHIPAHTHVHKGVCTHSTPSSFMTPEDTPWPRWQIPLLRRAKARGGRWGCVWSLIHMAGTHTEFTCFPLFQWAEIWVGLAQWPADIFQFPSSDSSKTFSCETKAGEAGVCGGRGQLRMRPRAGAILTQQPGNAGLQYQLLSRRCCKAALKLLPSHPRSSDLPPTQPGVPRPSPDHPGPRGLRSATMGPDWRTQGQRTSTQAAPPDTAEWKQLQDEADKMVSSVPLGACPRKASKGYKQGRGRLGGTERSRYQTITQQETRLVNTGQKVLRRQERQAPGRRGSWQTFLGRAIAAPTSPAFWMSSFQL